jgi:amino acid transporter
LGYYNICHLGSEIKNPSKNIPRSIFISITGIAILYLLMNVSVVSVVPWQEAKDSEFVISQFMEVLMGHTAATIVTCLILWVAFASVFSATLGYSRIPYAAAEDGEFFKVFARLHPTKDFPYVSVLFLGGVAFVFSMLFKLSETISAILAMRIMIQFIGQAIGLLILRSRKSETEFPYKMPLFPLPVIIAIAMWLFILISTGTKLMFSGMFVIFLGVIVYFVKAKFQKEWPFATSGKQ